MKGRESGDNMEVFGDIKTGDELVKSASEEIRNGSPVKVTQNAKGSGDANNSEGKELSSPSGERGAKKDPAEKK